MCHETDYNKNDTLEVITEHFPPCMELLSSSSP